MFVNADTLHSLQILGAESHPHSHNRGPTKANSGAKEGLSVYGLFHHLARTPQGRFLLRQHFLRPSLNLGVINERLDTIGICLRPENEPALDALVDIMKNVSNMRVMMINLRKGIATKGKGNFSRSVWSAIRGVSALPYQLWNLYTYQYFQFCFHCLQIKDTLQEIVGGEHLALRIKV
jgi:DNA mismatch repair protein MSH5